MKALFLTTDQCDPDGPQGDKQIQLRMCARLCDSESSRADALQHGPTNKNTGFGFVAGRRAFYVEGPASCLWRFLRLFGKYLEIRAEVMGCELEVRVHYHRSVCVADAAKAHLPHFTWCAPSALLPLQWCEAKPPGGRKHVSMFILLLADGQRADLLWLGELRRYRARIDAAGIFTELRHRDTGEYGASIMAFDLAAPQSHELLLRLLREIFRGLAMRLFVSFASGMPTLLKSFVDRVLCDAPTLHLDTSLLGHMRRSRETIAQWLSLALVCRCSDAGAGCMSLGDSSFRTLIFRFFLPSYCCVDGVTVWPGGAARVAGLPSKRPKLAAQPLGC